MSSVPDGFTAEFLVGDQTPDLPIAEIIQGQLAELDIEDIRTGNLLMQWPGGGPAFRFSTDGTYLLYSDGDAIRSSISTRNELIALAESMVTRRMTPDECRHYLDSGTCPTD